MSAIFINNKEPETETMILHHYEWRENKGVRCTILHQNHPRQWFQITYRKFEEIAYESAIKNVNLIENLQKEFLLQKELLLKKNYKSEEICCDTPEKNILNICEQIKEFITKQSWGNIKIIELETNKTTIININ